MSEGNGDGSDGKSRVLVEPEQEWDPPILSGLCCLRGLWSVQHLGKTAGGHEGIFGRSSGVSGGYRSEVDTSSPVAGAVDSELFADGVLWNFLTDESLPSGEFVWRHIELLVEKIGFGCVVVKWILLYPSHPAHLLAGSLTSPLLHGDTLSRGNRLYLKRVRVVCFTKLHEDTD